MTSQWSYSGDTSCANWGRIGFELAESGKSQSPINIEQNCCKLRKQSMNESLNYSNEQSIDCNVNNRGFTPTYVVKQDTESAHMTFNNETFKLLQFHFHSKSEHKIDDKHYPLELHLVHESTVTSGKLCVVGVFFEVGSSVSDNQFFKSVLASIPGPLQEGKANVSLKGLQLTEQYWNYEGSLTTPPCSEGVSWVVLQNVETVTKEQLQEYLKLFPNNTNRPVQELNNRVVCSYR